MTLYHRGKKRMGKALANVIALETDKICKRTGFQIKGYCEPFCGMLGVYQHIPDLLNGRYHSTRKLKYKASDTNGCVIEMWKAAKEGWKPPTQVTEDRYNSLKNQHKDTALRGYVGHQYGYGGKFFDSYAPNYKSSLMDSTYASQSVQRLGAIMKHYNVEFKENIYKQCSRLRGYVIYCDPPYCATKSVFYKGTNVTSFDSSEFWNWCKQMSRHNIVFVSEYTCPKRIGVKTVFEKKHFKSASQLN